MAQGDPGRRHQAGMTRRASAAVQILRLRFSCCTLSCLLSSHLQAAGLIERYCHVASHEGIGRRNQGQAGCQIRGCCPNPRIGRVRRQAGAGRNTAGGRDQGEGSLAGLHQHCCAGRAGRAGAKTHTLRQIGRRSARVADHRFRRVRRGAVGRFGQRCDGPHGGTGRYSPRYDGASRRQCVGCRVNDGGEAGRVR